MADDKSNAKNEVTAVTTIISELSDLDSDARERILHTVATFYGLTLRPTSSAVRHSSPLYDGGSGQVSTFSEERSITPKQFMMEKAPQTDVERVACLAYYLTHYRDTPHFKTLDISKLNTEAAQVKFSNPAFAVENAAKRNYVVPATRGNKQLSAAGEQFVQALPDREKAKVVMETIRSRRRSRRPENEAGEK